MERRHFLKKAAAGTAFLGVNGVAMQACAGPSQQRITILHTNDVHSHIDPFPSDHSRFANLGGLARRATLVAKIRQENPNTLLLDAGDIFQGTPYFNFYGGELEFKLMSKLKYDAATIGNHDFDNGIDGLLAQVPHATFDLLSANYDFSNTVLDGIVHPYKIFMRQGIKIGVYGLGIQLSGLVPQRLSKETRYLDPYEIAIDTEKHLKESESCDLVICLSHLGYDYRGNPNKPDDVTLATKTAHTDVIIGGHTHTFLERPSVHSNRNGDSVLVNQVGCYGINLGRIDFFFENGAKTGTDAVKITV
ncbi:metallophosphatase [Flagellimonas sp. DF-77]|uniref:bifunctional metallophosphatase/5'-nucleotidase n=1 Tax=Flagellimonas algarum TaxID=3230298 RepID=UPI00339891D9